MKTLLIKKLKGFTVIELMIVVMIVAILAALAYPSYVQYVRKAKRGDAQQLLLNWSINQEIWRSNNTTYAGVGALPAPIDADGNYVFSTNGNPDATSYELQADGSGSDQLNDTARNGDSCTIITLNQNGVKSPAACWE